MKNIKNLTFELWTRYALSFLALTFVCSSASALTIKEDAHWNGSYTVKEIGDKYLIECNGYNGQIRVSGTNHTSVDQCVDFKGWNADGDYVFQPNNQVTGSYCLSYDNESKVLILACGDCGANIVADKQVICSGENVTLEAVGVNSDDTWRWGTVSGTDTTWLDYDNQASIVVKVDAPTMFVVEQTMASTDVNTYSLLIETSLSACGYTVSVSTTNTCPGDEVYMTTDYAEGTLYEVKDASGAVVGESATPEVKFIVNADMTYAMYADGVLIGKASVKTSECSFFVTSYFPTSTCLQAKNYLMVVGSIVLDDVTNNVYIWEESSDKENWSVIEGETASWLPVYPSENTYYRAKYKGRYTSPFFYDVPDCSKNEACNGLQTRVLFYETFGYFMDANTYANKTGMFRDEMVVPWSVSAYNSSDALLGTAGVSDGVDYLDRIYANDGTGYYTARAEKGDRLEVSTESTSQFHVMNYVAPDPDGHVVTATKFEWDESGKSNQFVGTNGHLFLAANPMLSNYNWITSKGGDRAFRLQDGYYALVARPDSVDQNEGKDYAKCSDATGNVNGAMLFVNSGRTDVSQSAIYAQRVELGCAADRFSFGMSIRNAAIQEGLNPVNVSVLLLEDISETLPDEYRTLTTIQAEHILSDDISSGDIPSAATDWTRIDQYVKIDGGRKVTSLWVVLYNNGKSGDGNDMLLDDISFSVCLPKAELSANIDGELITGDVAVCDGRDVELVASQKGNYIVNPRYLFQYYDAAKGEWVDMKDYSTSSTYEETTVKISVTDSKFIGDVKYRVIIGASAEELRQVAANPTDVCNEFLVAESDILVYNTYGGPMCDNVNMPFCFVEGDTVIVEGCRNLSNPNHSWKAFWKNSKGDILVDTADFTAKASDKLFLVVEKDQSVTVYDREGKKTMVTDFEGISNLQFVGIDEGDCVHDQKFVLTPKHIVELSFDGTSAIGCDSILVQVKKDVPEAKLIWDWTLEGTVNIINDTAQVFYPAGLSGTATKEGVVKISVDNSGDNFCAPAEPMSIPYKVYNVSYGITVTPSSSPVCVTSGQAPETVLLALTATTTPESALNNITAFNWVLKFEDGTEVERTTSTNALLLTYQDLSGKTGQKLSAYLVSTETVNCGTVDNKDADSSTDIDIREGAFLLNLQPETSSVCLTSTDQFVLEAGVSPLAALSSLHKLTLTDEAGKTFDITTSRDQAVYSIVISKDEFPDVFVPGTTKYYKLSAYDEFCKAENTSNLTSVYLNGYSVKLSDPGFDGEECLTLGETITITANFDDPNATKLIKSYTWYKDGVMMGNDALSFDFPITESATSQFKLVVSDDICTDQADSLDVSVSLKYEVDLVASQNTVCGESDEATVSARITPESSRDMIKRFEWHAVVDGVDKVLLLGTPKDSVLVLNSTNFEWLIQPGVSADIYVLADDSICDEARSNGDVHFDFNTHFDMTIDWDTANSVCVSSESGIDPTLVLLKVDVLIDPVEALKQIKKFTWHIKGEKETAWTDFETTTNSVEFTYADLSKYKGQDISLYVSSYDQICTSPEDPALSDTVKVKIRVGGFSVDLDNIPTAYCIDTLGDAQFTLKAKVDPAEAISNVSEFYWYDNGGLIAKTTEPVFVLTKSSYEHIFKAGYTANFSVAAFDEACAKDTVKSNNSTKVEFNVPFKLKTSASHSQICLPVSSEVSLYATTEPADAANHIKSYVWTLLSPIEVTKETSTNSLLITEWLSAGNNLVYSVTAFDDVCYNEAGAGAGASDTIPINQSFVPTLTAEKEFVCTKNGKVKLHTSIEPNDSYIQTFEYRMIYKDQDVFVSNGDMVNVTLDGRNATISSDLFPEGLISGEYIGFYVVADDGGVCGSRASSIVLERVQNPFTIHMNMEPEVICVGSQATASVVSITPPESEQFIKYYSWYTLDRGMAQMIEPKGGKVMSSTNFPVGVTQYFVKAVDSICYTAAPKVSDTVSIDVHDYLQIKFYPSVDKYCYPVDGTVTLTAEAVTGSPSHYELYDATGTRLFSVNTNRAACIWEGFQPTVNNSSYRVKVLDGICSYDDNTAIYADTYVRVHEPVEIAVSSETDVCEADSIHLRFDVLAGTPSQFHVSGLALTDSVVFGVDSTTMFMRDISMVGAELEYAVYATDEICPASDVVLHNVLVHEQPQIKLVSDKEDVVIGGEILLMAQIEKGLPTLFDWYCDGNQIGTTVGEPYIYYLPSSTSDYKVFASDPVCQVVSDVKSLEVKLPTAFTPHYKDGMNDTFLKGFDVVIYDRYGQKVFEGPDGWDGEFRGKMADPGVYYYQVVLKDNKVEKGTIEVIKAGE